MSRIGKLPVPVASSVAVTISPDNLVTVKGSKGQLSVKVDPAITVVHDGGEIRVSRSSDEKRFRALHGLYRALIQNIVTGVTDGFKKELEIIGVGYRASMNGPVLELALGYSHPYYFVPPAGITLDVDTKTSKNPRIMVTGSDKELVGQVAAKIRSLRKPEPYKGKGIRYIDEVVRKKAGKSAGR
jgi:large subunit ribosomal protein L6